MLDENTTYQTIVDSTDSNNVYYGFAELGRSTSSGFWRIYKKNTNGSIVTTYYPIGTQRNPDDGFNFIWDERDHYNYSLIPDAVAPTLSTVTIASDNTVTTSAKVGDEITLTIVSSEAIQAPIVTIGGNSATTVAGADTLHWTATYTMVSGDTEGTIAFTINFMDLGGIPGVEVTTITGGSNVTFDKTAPTATLLYSVDGGSNYYTTITTKNADTLRIKATFSEAMADSPVVKLAIDNTVLSATDMTKTNTTTYYYDLNVPAGDIATATCSLSVGTDVAGNVITSAPTNATFTIDNTTITLDSAVRDSDTQITVTLSELALESTITKANDGGFVVFETGTPGTTYAVSAIAPGATDDLVVLTVADLSASDLVGVTVTYTAGGNGTVSDVAGNALATDGTGVVISAWDAAPTMTSAERLSNTTLKVYLSEDCSDATITKANDGGFVVFETGTPATTYAVSAISKSGSNADQIELTVADVTASASIGLTVTYTAGGNGNVADLLGNLMATDGTGQTIASWA